VLQPSEDAAYFWGILSGDGSLSRLPRTECLCIACDSTYQDLIEGYSNLLGALFGKRVGVFERGNCVYLRIYKKGISEYIGAPCGKKEENGFIIPEWIWAKKEYVVKFMRGLIETDGGFYQARHNGGEYWFCIFTAKNTVIMDAFERAATYLGYEFRRQGVRCRLSRTSEVKRLRAELAVEKIRRYNYEPGPDGA
jgi:hypothetical protein